MKNGVEQGFPLGGAIGEAAAEASLTILQPSLTPNTRLAFEASEFAKDEGLFEDFHNACYKAMWEEGLNLGDISVLETLGKRVGLDTDMMRARLEKGYYTIRTKAQYEEAIDLGINGIPSFIMGRYLFSGAQPYDVFRQVAEKVLAESLNDNC